MSKFRWVSISGTDLPSVMYQRVTLTYDITHGEFSVIDCLNPWYVLAFLPCLSHRDKCCWNSCILCRLFCFIILFVTIWYKGNKLITYLSFLNTWKFPYHNKLLMGNWVPSKVWNYNTLTPLSCQSQRKRFEIYVFFVCQFVL